MKALRTFPPMIWGHGAMALSLRALYSASEMTRRGGEAISVKYSTNKVHCPFRCDSPGCHPHFAHRPS